MQSPQQLIDVSDSYRLQQAPAALLEQLPDLDDLQARRARYDPVAFLSYVLKDEETGGPIQLQPMHVEWQRLATAHRHLLIWGHTESGKSQELSVGRVLWELGKNPNLRILIISDTVGQATKLVMMIRRYIEGSREYKKVFPHVEPGEPWTTTELYLKRPAGIAKDPSVRASGLYGNITGGRADLGILDDILDAENTRTQAQRDRADEWLKSASFEGRLTDRSRVWVVGTAWHIDDVMHRYARAGTYFCVRYPLVLADGSSSWPERWSRARILERRKRMGEFEFARAMMCVARSDEEARFKREWIDKCLRRGDGYNLTYALQAVPDGYATFTGVDLGVRQKASSDLTVLFTIVVHPDGTREVLDIDAGKWTGPQIVEKIKDVHHRYESIVWVESNAAQDFIVQFTRGQSAVPVMSFDTTGYNKNHPEHGLAAMGVEMENAKWIIPNRGGVCHPEVSAWLNDMLYYDPNGHPGDRLMASWIAREGSRLTRPKAKLRRLDLLSR